MTESHIGHGEAQKDVLVYLKSLQLLTRNIDLTIRKGELSGSLKVRNGAIVAGSYCGLVGNGAVLSLAGLQDIEITKTASEEPTANNVSFSFDQIERLLARMPQFPKDAKICDEESELAEAIHLIYQFKRKEAGAKLVEILRYNRFYYPAWLWYTRLMTRVEFIKKAQSEAEKWGNDDAEILREIKKIEPQLASASDTVRRCFFCWSLVKTGETKCSCCAGFLRVDPTIMPERLQNDEIELALPRYQKELLGSQSNTRIAYCLCLGFYSLGNFEQARAYLDQALAISPQEPLLVKASTALAVIEKKSGIAVEVEEQEEEDLFPAPAAMSSTEEPVAFKSEEIPAPPVTPQKEPVPPAPEVSKEKDGQKAILVVEDSPTSRKVIAMVLARSGYAIHEAETGSEALVKIKERAYDLILLDAMLPDTTGFILLPQLKELSINKDIQVVMLTGKKGSIDRQKGMRAGCAAYLTKPFDPGKLLSTIRRYV